MENIRAEIGEINAVDVGGMYTDGTYLEKNSTWHAEDSPWKASQIIKLLSKNNVTPETIGEVGCGAGEILRQLSYTLGDTRFCGYELSPQAYDLCKTRETEKVRFKNQDIIEDDVFFDVLLCIDVFEHVDDYIGFVKAIRSKATYKVFHIPLEINVISVLREGMMASRNAFGHLHYFTPSTAIATLADSGYEVIDSFYTPFFADFPSPTLKAKRGKLIRKMVYAVSPDLMVKIFSGCSLIVLAR